MIKLNYRSLFSFFLIIVCAVPLYYVIYKALTVSFTHDESFSYNFYVNTSVGDIIAYNGNDLPNNHILNTLLMKLSQGIFGSSEFALRLPNVLAYFSFLIFSVLWLKKFSNKFILIAGLIILHYNPFILDFFALARGYGLSLAGLFISIYFFHSYISSFRRKDVFLSFLFAALAVWSNFTLLNYFVSLLAVFNLVLIYNLSKNKTPGKNNVKAFFIANIPAVLVSGILAALIVRPLQVINANLFGPVDGFYQNTMRSLAAWTIRMQSNELITVLCVFVFVIILAQLAVIIYEFFKKNEKVALTASALFLLMILPALSTIFQHLLLGTQFLENRTGIFFIVLFSVNIIFLLSCLFSRPSLKLAGFITAFIYPCFLIINLISNYDLHFYLEWKYDAYTKEMLAALEEDHKNSPEKDQPVKLGVSWELQPSIEFYRKTKHLDWLREVTREGYGGPNDNYYYEYGNDAFLETNKPSVIKNFTESNVVLIKAFSEKKTNICLKAANGKFVIADLNFDSKLFANSDNDWTWETFEMEKSKKDVLRIRSSNGKYVRADQHSKQIIASTDLPGEWETFVLVPLDNDLVALKAINGKYLSVDAKSSQLFANAGSVGPQEKFKLVIK